MDYYTISLLTPISCGCALDWCDLFGFSYCALIGAMAIAPYGCLGIVLFFGGGYRLCIVDIFDNLFHL